MNDHTVAPSVDELDLEAVQRTRAELAHDGAIANGEPLADFECPHGALPHDRERACACFAWKADPDELDWR